MIDIQPQPINSSRRTFMLTAVCTAVVAACGGGEGGAQVGSASDQPPTSAYSRALGASKASERLVIPEEITSFLAGYVDQSNQGGRGLALGGLGSGSFMLNQQGTFGPWSFNGRQENRVLRQAAFHLLEMPEGGPATVKTLAVPTPASPDLPAPTSFSYGPNGSLLPAWPTLSPGDAIYKALYPFGWMEYKTFKAEISTRFWSPIVAKDELRSSMPVAYFDVRIKNNTSKRDTIAVMFTFPNAPIHVADVTPPFWLPFGRPYLPASVRKGFQSRYESDSATGVVGVTLSAHDPANTVDSEDTEWTIAARPQKGQTVSHITSWNAEGDGSDVLDAFSANGVLPNGALDSSNSAGAVSVKVVLEPGESSTLQFALAWDIPLEVAKSEAGTTTWMKRYTEAFGARQSVENDYVAGSYAGRMGFKIASRMLGQHDDAIAAVERWWAPLVNDDAYPDWLKRSALNQLAYNVYGSSFFVNGLVSNTIAPTGGKRLGTVFPDTHLFGVATGADGADQTILNADVSPYAYLNWAQLFPKLHRDVMRAAAEVVNRNAVGALSDMGSVAGGSPFISYADSNSGLVGHFQFADRQPKFVYRVYEEYKRTGDAEFFRYAYPAMVKAYDRFKQNVPAGAHLPIGESSTYDWVPGKGFSLYNSGMYLLANQVMVLATQDAIKLQVAGASQSAVDAYAAELASAKQQFEAVFWDGGKQRYRWASEVTPTTRGTGAEDGLMADGLYAQHVAEQMGLPDLVPLEHLVAHLKAVYHVGAVPFKDANGRLRGALNLLDNTDHWYGASVGSNPLEGGSDFQAREAWSGTNYVLSAMMVRTGKRVQDASLVEAGAVLGRDVSYHIWENPDNGFEFNAPEAWDVTDIRLARNSPYLRPLSIWDTLNAFKPVTVPDPLPANNDR